LYHGRRNSFAYYFPSEKGQNQLYVMNITDLKKIEAGKQKRKNRGRGITEELEPEAISGVAIVRRD